MSSWLVSGLSYADSDRRMTYVIFKPAKTHEWSSNVKNIVLLLFGVAKLCFLPAGHRKCAVGI
jgi:hypothetical protein